MTDRGYKRSWKNLLINKRYQLRFTLFMAGLAAALMAALGWWVTRVADEATTVAKSRARGTKCPPTPDEVEAESGARAPVKVDVGEIKVGQPPAAKPDPAPAGEGGEDRTVTIDESSMTLTPEPPPPSIPPQERDRMIKARDACERGIAARLTDIDDNRELIVIVLVASGVLLTLGLLLFGIKMTHKVAGPLHKVTLYLAKLRDGRYDKVYDLRKGDQLVEFYEHFRHAHAGVVAMERDDIDRIKAALDAAVADGVLERSPEAKAAAAALRTVLERKEASFV